MGTATESTIKAIIFDIGGVFVPLVFKPIFEELEAKNNLEPATIYRALLESGNDGPFAQLQRGEIDERQFGVLFSEYVSKIAGKSVDMSQLMVQFEERKLKRSVRPAMTDAVRCIRAEGINTAVLTNNWPNFSGKTNIQVEPKHFDVIVESCKEGMMKPDPRIYELTLERLNMSPQEAVFVDDLYPNIEAARKLGLHTVHFQTESQTIAELERLLGFRLSGYMEGTTSVPKRLRFNENKLKLFLQENFRQNSEESLIVRCYSHGQSNPTYFVRYGDRDMVLRKKPPGKLLPSAHAIEREYRVMKAVREQGVPVPQMLCLCQDASVIGTPFYIMEHVKGRIFLDSLLPGMAADQRRYIYLEMIRVLARIHSVNLTKAGLDDFGKKDGRFMLRNFERWYRQYDSSRTGSEPESMEQLSSWLRENLPASSKTTLIHGDYRLDNLIFHPTRPEVIAVLDWELSTLGDPLSDVAHNSLPYYCPDGATMNSIAGLGPETIGDLGIPCVEDIIKCYVQHTGPAQFSEWNVYVAFVFFRMAAISQGVYKRYTIGQAASPKAELSGQAVAFLADLGLTATQTNLSLQASKL